MNNKQQLATHIIEKLAQHKQRVTYAALGDLVGLPAQSVMQGRPKEAKNSWVVSKSSGLPTGYSTAEMGDWMNASPIVLDSAAHLQDWLEKHAR